MSKIVILEHGTSEIQPVGACNYLHQSDLLAQKTVLLIDDDTIELGIISQVLRPAGYRVLTADDGETGLVCAHRAVPDLILLDICMPDLSGYSVCRQLRENEKTKHIPIIFKSCLSKAHSVIEGFRSGSDSYITKPCNHDQLLRLVSHVIKNSRLDNIKSTVSAIQDVFVS